jgi:hypothetical protein
MNSIAQMTASSRADMFAETADRKGLPEAVVEKDFWVCWVLKQLFSIDAFSGTTSLGPEASVWHRWRAELPR